MTSALKSVMSILFLGVVVLYFTGCTKKMNAVSVEDYSLQDSLRFNDMLAVGDHVFLVGGNQFSRSSIYTFEKNKLNAVSLPAQAEQKELYGIAYNGFSSLLAVSYSGGLFSSQDSGRTWSYVQSPLWKEFRSLVFLDQDSAVTVARTSTRFGFICRGDKYGYGYSSDANLKEYNFELNKIRKSPQGTLLACGYGAILKSTDRGLSWSFTDAKNDWFKSICWKNDAVAFAVGYMGSILKTTNAGERWDVLRNANNTFLKRLHFLDVAVYNETVTAVGEKGLVWVSTDLGAHWKPLEKFTSKDLYCVHLKSDKEIIVAGESGALFTIALP